MTLTRYPTSAALGRRRREGDATTGALDLTMIDDLAIDLVLPRNDTLAPTALSAAKHAGLADGVEPRHISIVSIETIGTLAAKILLILLLPYCMS